MRQFVLSVIMLFGIVAFSNKLFASEPIEILATNSGTYAGTYDGTLTKVYMNGDKATGQSVQAVVTDNGNGTINLELKEFKVGNMPGTIRVKSNNIEVENDGSFNMLEMSDVVILKILGISEKTFDADITGSFNNGSLTFTVKTVDAKYLGIPFEAIVTFQSK